MSDRDRRADPVLDFVSSTIPCDGEREGGGGGGVVLRATVGQRMERGDRLRVIDEQ